MQNAPLHIRAHWNPPKPGDDQPVPPGKPKPKPVEEPPGKPGRTEPDPTPIDDPRPPKPPKQAAQRDRWHRRSTAAPYT